MALAAACRTTSAVWALADAVDSVLAEPASQQSASELADELVELRSQIDRLEAAFADRLSCFERLHGHVAQGATSVVAWVRHRCRLSSEAATARAGVARLLPAVHGAQEAWRQGEIGFAHAAVIAEAVADVGARAMSTVAETVLDAARHLDVDRFRVVIRHLRHSLDADGEAAAAARLHERRYLRINAIPGRMCVLDAQLDPEGGALLRSALEPLCRRAPGDTRSAAARRADALVELARRLLSGAGALPAVNGERPRLLVTTTLPTLAGVQGAPAGQLQWGGTVPAATVRRIACDAAVTFYSDVCDATKALHAAERRAIPVRLRRALFARDGGCRFPSCDRPPDWTDAHHIVHWVDGGKTRLDNLVLLCRTHHGYVHERGWHIRWGDGGTLVVEPP